MNNHKATASLRISGPPGDSVHIVANWYEGGGWGSTLCGRYTHRKWVKHAKGKPVGCKLCLRKLDILVAAAEDTNRE